MLRSLFALFAITVFASYAFKHVYAAMLMYWWFGIFRPQEWMWWDVSSLRLPLLTAALFVCTAFARGYNPRPAHPVGFLIIIFYVFALLASLNGCVTYESVTIVYLTILVLVTLITERTLHSEKAIWGLVFVAAASLSYYSATLSLDAIVNNYSLYDKPIARGSFSDSNSSALGAAMSVFFLLFLIGVIGGGKSCHVPALLSKNVIRIIFKTGLYFLLILSIIFVFKTESRGSALSMMLGFVVWTVLHPNKLKITGFWCLVLATLLFVGIPDTYRERLASAFVESDELDHSAKSRPHYWDTAKLMASSNPIGVGIGCFKVRYNDYDNSGGAFGRYRSVHSSHYSVLAETGYPGFIVWIVLLLTSYATLFKIRSRSKWGRQRDTTHDFYFKLSNSFIATLTVFIAGGSFYELAYNDYTWLMFAMIIAMHRLQKRNLTDKAKSEKSPSGTTQSL